MLNASKFGENTTVKIDKANKFYSIFNRDSGFYMRSGVIEDGKDTGNDPFMASYPELLDIGIRGVACEAGIAGVCHAPCYQNRGSRHNKDITLEDYESIMKQSRGKVFQVALGGSADPCLHPQFEEILKLTRKYNIVPSYTTSGYLVDDKIVNLSKEFCGAVAVSWERNSEIRDAAINKFLEAKVKTNIHYVLGKDSIDEAITRLKDNKFPVGINAVIFLLYKGIGLGDKDKMLTVDDPRVEEFFYLVDNPTGHFKIGLDACSVPGLLNFATEVNLDSISSCDGSTYSAYIDANMIMYPCSFGIHNPDMYGVDLKEISMQDAWESDIFKSFRDTLKNSCPSCNSQSDCKGGCPILSSISLCSRDCRTT